jgi:hypothetical protein
MNFSIKVLVLVSTLLLIACSDEQQEAISNFGGQLSDILELKREIDSTLQEGESGVNINNGIALTISLVNTELNGKSAEEREQKANELLTMITEFIAKYQSLSTVKYVTIVYVKHETKYLIVNFNEPIDHYSYDLEENDQETPESEPRQTSSLSFLQPPL